MGGVMIFQGDRHTLSPSHLERSGGTIKVPKPVRLPENRRAFTVEERELGEVVEEMFTMQSMYVNDRLHRAHSLWATNDPMQQKSVDDIDRSWARFAISLGMIDELPEWVTRNILSGAALANVVRCPLCSKPQTDSKILLCPFDHAPYNTLQAYLAGAPVAQQYLDLLDGDELDQYAYEQARREERRKAALARGKKQAKADAVPTDETGAGE